MLSESKGGKAELEGALAAPFHGALRGVPRPLRVHVEIGREGHPVRLQSGSVGYVVEGFAYVFGTMLIGAGLYLVMRGTFPTWWRRRLLWPLVRVTPTVSHLQGWAAIGLGISVLAIVFTTVAPELVAGLLVVLALAAYLVGVALFVFSTWLSRRPA